MSQQPLAPPPPFGDSGRDRWLWLLWQRVAASGQVKWSQLDFTSSTLTDILTRNHVDLQNLQGGTTAEYYHLTSAEYTGTGTGVLARKTSPAFTGTASFSALTVSASATLNGVTGLGAAASTSVRAYLHGSTLTGVNQWGVYVDEVFTNAATTSASAAYFRLKTQADAFTVTTGKIVELAASPGATSSISTLHGLALTNISSAGTVVYGFSNAMAAGTDKWGLYFSGTVANAIAGSLRLGSLVAPTATLDVTGTAAISGAFSAASFNGNTLSSSTAALSFAAGSSLTTVGAFATSLTFTGATTVTFPLAGTLATLGGTETLSSKTISGSSNTLSNIANASLTNSSITIAGHAVSLGGTQTLAAADLTDTVVGAGAIVLKSYADGLGSFPVELQAYAAAQG